MAEIGVLGLRPGDQAHEHVAAQVADITHLDLDHIRAHIGEEQTGVRSLDFLGDLDNFHPRERSRHKRPPAEQSRPLLWQAGESVKEAGVHQGSNLLFSPP